MLNKKSIENCKVVEKGIEDDIGKPLAEELNEKEYCQGYQKGENDDEPYHECANCTLNILNYS